MVDKEYSTGDYKYSNISSGAAMKDPEMLKFIPDHLKTKKMCNYAFTKLHFIIRYIINIRLKKCAIKLF